MRPAGGRLGTVLTTAVVTSLVWIGGLVFWFGPGQAPVAPAPTPTAAIAPQPAAAPLPSEPAAANGQGLLIPVVGVMRAQLVDTYTQSRAGGARRHDAIDIMAPRGTHVIAAAAGKVEKLFLSKDGGNTIYIRSPDGRLLYYYAHLDSYAPDLAVGQEVNPGTPLGTVGSTGDANPAAPHLHFAIAAADPAGPWYQKAPALNPYPWLMSGKIPDGDAALARASRPDMAAPSAAATGTAD